MEMNIRDIEVQDETVSIIQDASDKIKILRRKVKVLKIGL